MASDFVYTYFINPIINPEIQGYNIVNTAVYIVLLIITCALIYLALRKKIEFNSKFFVSLTPYILFGISMRVLMYQIEAELLSLPWLHKTADPMQIGFWFFTPGIWILTFIIVVIGLLLAGVITSSTKTSETHKKLNTKRLLYFGIIVCAAPLIFNFTRFNNWLVFLGTAALIAVVAYGVCRAINRFTKYKILSDPLNLFIVAGQAIDGISTAVAISFFNFSEQHVVSNAVLNIHPALFVIIKLGIAGLICYSLDDYIKDYEKRHAHEAAKISQRKNLVGFVKVIIAILGFATGLASLFKLGII